jgi:hypothetical protein
MDGGDVVTQRRAFVEHPEGGKSEIAETKFSGD